MSLQRWRPGEMYFTKPSPGNYSATLISNRLVPITPGYIIFSLIRKMKTRMRLKGVIACLHDKNYFLNCLRFTDSLTTEKGFRY